MIDAEEGVTEQWMKIAGIAHERGKVTIIVVNMDAIEKDDKIDAQIYGKGAQYLSSRRLWSFCSFSREDGQRLPKLFGDHRYRQREPRHKWLPVC